VNPGWGEGPPFVRSIQVGLRRALVAMPAARLRILRETLEQVARDAELDRVEAPFFVS